MKPALLVVDIQNEWLDRSKEMKACVVNRVDTINSAIAWFRERKLPVIVIYHQDKNDGPKEGTRAFEFLESVAVRADDIKITKNYPNAFCKTNLEAVLRGRGCDAVILSGISATWCVMGTFFGAIDCDLNPFLLQGGVAADNEERTRFAEQAIDTKSLEQIKKELG